VNPYWRFQIDRFKRLLIRWVVYCHIAFIQLENRYFRELLHYFNGRLSSFLPSAAKTVRKWLLEEYQELKQVLKDDVLNSRSKVSISFDLWTSPAYHAFIAICAHFIDNNGKRRHELLALRRVEGSHSAYNLKDLVVGVLREYYIDTEDKVGYFMLDNASVNDLAVKLILQELFSHWSESRIKRRRLRCLGHVVNIAAKRFLEGGSPEETLRSLRTAFEQGDEEAALELFGKHTALSTLHSLIRYVRMTPERRERFAQQTVQGDYEKYNKLEVCECKFRPFSKKRS
jgi:hypothetical protein